MRERGVGLRRARSPNARAGGRPCGSQTSQSLHPSESRGDSEALCKTQYIGKAGGVKHQQALAAITRRKQLNQIQNQIAQLEGEVGSLSKS